MIIKEIRICGVLEGAGGGGEERKEREKKTNKTSAICILILLNLWLNIIAYIHMINLHEARQEQRRIKEVISQTTPKAYRGPGISS